jgi:hypothetical protein
MNINILLIIIIIYLLNVNIEKFFNNNETYILNKNKAIRYQKDNDEYDHESVQISKANYYECIINKTDQLSTSQVEPENLIDELNKFYKRDINEDRYISTHTHFKFDKDYTVNPVENKDKTIMEIYDDLVNDGRYEITKSTDIAPFDENEYFDIADNDKYGYTNFTTYK